MASPPGRPTTTAGGWSDLPWAPLVAALALRLAWAALARETPLRGDEAMYVGAARSIAAGLGYSYEGHPVTHYMPGWPLLLAAPFRLGLGLAGARLLLCLVSTLVVLEAYVLAGRLSSRRTGLAAAWFTALFPPLVWYADAFTSETASAALVGGWAAAGMAYVDEGGDWRRVSSIVVLGALLALVRAELVILAPLPFLVRAATRFSPTEIARSAVAALAVAAALAPWVIYNQRRIGETIVLSTASGVGLWIASHDPPVKEFDGPDFRDAVARLNVPGRPRETDARFAAEARARIRRDPFLYLRGRILDLPRCCLASHSEIVPGAEAALGVAWRERNLWALLVKVVGFSSQAVLILGALAGAALSYRAGGSLFLLLVAGAKFAVHLPFVQAARFSLHIAPLLCAYCAVAIVGWLDRRPSRRSGP